MDEKIPLEKVIVNAIFSWLKSAGYTFIWKSHGSAYARAGLPDIVVIGKCGRFCGLECKRPKIGRLTDLQARTLNRITESGGYAAVVVSVEEAKAAMADAESGKPGRTFGFGGAIDG